MNLFNVGSSSPTREIISLSADFPHGRLVVDDGPSRATRRRIVVRHYSSGAYSGPWSDVVELGGQELEGDCFPFVEVQVAPRGFEILTAHPVCTCGSVDLAVLGLLEKMAGPAAIWSLKYQVTLSRDNSAQVEIRVGLKALGFLGT